MTEPLLVCNNNGCISVGTVFYNIIPPNTLHNIGNEVERLASHFSSEKLNFEVLVSNQIPFNSNILGELINWINKIQKRVVKITYNWITSSHVNTNPDETYYILTLYSDDWMGTYLSIKYNDWSTIKYTRSAYLYPDERDENQHYYDGGCLIVNPANGLSRQILASNCIIFHVK